MEEPKKLIAMMKRRFKPGYCAGWDSTVHIMFADVGPITVKICDGALDIRSGLHGRPVVRVATNTKTLTGLMAGKLQFDITYAQGELSSDNIVEAFKFVTVFEPDAYRGELTASAAAKRHSPVLAGKKEAVAFLSDWAASAASDPAVRIRAVESGLKGSLAVRARKPDFVLSFSVSSDCFDIKCGPSAKAVDFETDAGSIHRVLSGTQNFRSGLDQESIEALKPGAKAVLDLFVYLQPTLSHIYREKIKAVASGQ